MAWNGSGRYSPPLPPTFPAVAGSTVRASQFNDVIDDVATALSNCLTADGQNPATADIRFNGFKARLLATPTDLTDGANKSYVDDGIEAALANFAGTNLGSSAAHGQAFYRKIRANQDDVYLFTLSDSTWNSVNEPFYRWINEVFKFAVPTHTIVYRLYINGSSWQAPVTIQTGTGPYTIYIDNCAIPGSGFQTSLGSLENDIYQFGRTYDLVLVNHGHNFGYLLTQEDTYDHMVVCMANLLELHPRADFFVTLQNPWLRSLAYSRATQSNWRRIASELGLGIIDVSQKFETLANLNDPVVGGYGVTAAFTNGSASITGVNLPTTAGAPVTFVTTGTLPTNFATTTIYYVLAGSTSTNITVSASVGGSPVTAASAGSGVHTCWAQGTFDALYYDQDGNSGLHPSEATGVAIAISALTEALAERTSSGAPTIIRPFGRTARNLLPNPKYASWAGSTPDNHNFTNCVPAKSVPYKETGVYGMAITPGAGASPVKTVDVSPLLPLAKKRWLSYIARVWVPTGLSNTASRIQISTTGASNRTKTSLTLPSGRDGWRWIMVCHPILDTDVSITLTMLCGDAAGADNGLTFYVDREIVVTGRLPADLDSRYFDNAFLPDFFDKVNTGIPAGFTGTLVVTGNNVVVTAGTAPNTRAYGNFATVPGRSYRISWGVRTFTGAAGFTISARGPNGGGTVIATSGAVTSGSSFTFTATGFVTSWSLNGGADVTAMTVNGMTIVELYSGLTASLRPNLLAARNSDFTPVDTVGGVGKFKIVGTLASPVYLAGEAAQNITRTDTAFVEMSLPDNYIPGRDFNIVINAHFTGGGTAGTKTVVPRVYRIAADSTSSADLVLTAAATISNAAASYTFGVNGATFSPGDRFIVAFVTVLQETANVSTITAQVNSIAIS